LKRIIVKYNFYAIYCSCLPTHMKRAIVERNIVVVLFILVLIAFSFAEKDSKKLDQLYTQKAESFEPVKKQRNIASAELEKKPAGIRLSRN
jgi:hypothetical protein